MSFLLYILGALCQIHFVSRLHKPVVVGSGVLSGNAPLLRLNSCELLLRNWLVDDQKGCCVSELLGRYFLVFEEAQNRI